MDEDVLAWPLAVSSIQGYRAFRYFVEMDTEYATISAVVREGGEHLLWLTVFEVWEVVVLNCCVPFTVQITALLVFACTSKSGLLSIQEFIAFLKVEQSRFTEIVFGFLDLDKSGQLDYKGVSSVLLSLVARISCGSLLVVKLSSVPGCFFGFRVPGWRMELLHPQLACNVPVYL